MNKIIFLLLSVVLAFATHNTYSQTNYYPNDSGIIEREGYSYKYRPYTLSLAKDLYNSDIVYYNLAQVKRNGEIYSYLNSSGKLIENANLTMRGIQELILGEFTTTQKELIKRNEIKSLLITLTINPTSGRVADVIFALLVGSNFHQIPIEVYRSIELELKSKLIFNLADTGRNLNYVTTDFFIDM